MRLLVLLLLAGCAAPFGTDADDSPLVVTTTDGTASTVPLISWSDVDATSVWVTDEDGRTVWGLHSGGRTGTDGAYEVVGISSPVPYGAYGEGTTLGAAPQTTTAAGVLEPGVTYTAHVSYLGGGSGGFIGRRPVVRQGEATFRVAVRLDPGD